MEEQHELAVAVTLFQAQACGLKNITQICTWRGRGTYLKPQRGVKFSGLRERCIVN